MTDRAMLEAAAKAAGIELEWEEVGTGDPDCDPGWYCVIKGTHRSWNPRDDDADSRRLQVALRLEVSVGQEGVTAVDEFGAVEYTEWFPSGASLDDRCAATRLVVLKCAAAIHEAQPS